MGDTDANREVRRAGPVDAADAARLMHNFNSEFSAPTPGVAVLTERYAALLATDELIVLLAGGEPDGFAQLRFRPSVISGALDATLEELYVAPPRRGDGLGRALLEVALDVSRAAGATVIELNTGEDDVAARALYESLGFSNREGDPDGPLMLFYEREL